MSLLDGPRQQHSFESICTCIDDLQHLNTNNAFDGVEDQRQWQLRFFCTPLLLAIKHPSEHLQRLDTHFSQLLPDTLKRPPGSVPPNSTADNDSRANKARHLLYRLPRVPQELFNLPFYNSGLIAKPGAIWDGFKDGRWAKVYLVPEARSKFRVFGHDDPGSLMQLIADMQDIAWDNLFVTSFIDTNNCIFLLKIADLGHQPDLDFALGFRRYIDVLGELVDVYETLVDAARLGFKAPFEDLHPSVQELKAALFPHETDGHGMNLSTLKAFLWSAWQRSIMLYFYYVIGVQLWHGSLSEWSSLLAVRGVRRLTDLDAEDYRGDSTEYLCNWAFELLRTNRTSLALDFRRMIYLFDNHFQGLEGRCIKGSESACQGDLPESCERFTNAEAKSQSLHATTCDGSCARIRWNETSYRQCENPRAVKVNENDESLSYCRASSNTMAISHVWSHGQGGRPEDGINLCLHQRYCHLANSFDCDSYWIDSSCIPDDLELRKEAIMAINGIFCDSKVTLISDKDLQSKEISAGSMEDLETLLSILLVCDWGVRAWTMLEAIRGNESIHILCAGDQAIRLVDLLRKIHDEGAVDLAVLLGSAQHLLPSADSSSAKPIEEVGHLLSQRHASRKDDEIVIWGLLSKLKAPKIALQLWEPDEQISTAFLMSSAPRLKGTTSHGWAPATPYIRPQCREVQLVDGGMQVYSVRYPSYDGRGSSRARITPQGLESMWLAHDLDRDYIGELCDSCVEEMMPPPWTDADVEDALPDREYDTDARVFERPDYANACFTLKTLSSTPDTKVRIIRPLTSEGNDPYLGNVDRGENFTILIAICVCAEPTQVDPNSNDPGYDVRDRWQWKGVYEWIDDIHPDWTVKEMLIV